MRHNIKKELALGVTALVVGISGMTGVIKNCGKTTSCVVKPGQTIYYATSINGTNYTHVKLRITGHDGYGKAGGTWSPDSTS